MPSHKCYLNNPALLKIELMLRGVRVGNDLLRHLGEASSGAECLGGSIDIIISHHTRVNVSFSEVFHKRSPYHLDLVDGKYFITRDGDKVEVEIVPIPPYCYEKTATGVPFRSIGALHGRYLVVTPSRRCDFFKNSMECRYCAAISDEDRKNPVTYSVDEVLETVRAARLAGGADIIYLSIGFSDGEDGGIEFLRPYIKAIKKNYSSLVAVEALPPLKNRWVDETYAMGVDSVLYNLEIFDRELFELICPGRARLIGRERYIKALKYAATVFPNGTVASHLIVGLEPPGSTIQGIDFLTGIGVIPILPVYTPSSARSIKIEPLTTEVVAPVYANLYNAIRKRKLNMNWVRDISIITTPLEGRFLVDGGKGFVSLLGDLYGTRVGVKAAWGLSTIRRKLRVRETGDSFETADSDTSTQEK